MGQATVFTSTTIDTKQQVKGDSLRTNYSQAQAKEAGKLTRDRRIHLRRSQEESRDVEPPLCQTLHKGLRLRGNWVPVGVACVIIDIARDERRSQSFITPRLTNASPAETAYQEQNKKGQAQLTHTIGATICYFPFLSRVKGNGIARRISTTLSSGSGIHFILLLARRLRGPR